MPKDCLFDKVLLKLSGEGFCEAGGKGISPKEINGIAQTLKDVHALGVQLAVVVGGGNMLRGAALSERGMDRDTADYMGMLGTLINALALQSALEALDVPTRVQTAINTDKVATDTVSVLRARELGMSCLLKATKVDGVYTSDPITNPEARRYSCLSYEDAIGKRLRVMDATAFTLAEENQVRIVVFNVKKEGSLLSLIKGEDVGTHIDNFESSKLS
jgi:uridylate kinase